MRKRDLARELRQEHRLTQWLQRQYCLDGTRIAKLEAKLAESERKQDEMAHTVEDGIAERAALERRLPYWMRREEGLHSERG